MKKLLQGIGIFLAAAVIAFGVNYHFAPIQNQTSIQGGNTQRLSPALRYVLTSSATTTVGSTMNVADYQFIGWSVATQAASNTLKFACSLADTAPNFAVAASVTNTWDYVNVTDLNTESAVVGSSGITFANSSTVRQLQSRNANYRWCTANVSSWTNGTTTISILPATNQ